MKILYVTTISNTVNAFLIPHIKMLIDQGHEVDVAFSTVQKISQGLLELGCKTYEIEFQRSPFKKENMTAYKKIRKLILTGGYDIVHTHTPVASFLTRFACRDNPNIKVIYTAHGFHFYKGAPLLNWMLYYPMEKFLSRYTDVLITINGEDYSRAKTFKAKKIFCIPGVGIDTQKISNCSLNAEAIRNGLGVPKDAFMLVTVGELNRNKNQKTIIQALTKLNQQNVYFVICGIGSMREYLENMAKESNVLQNVIFAGYMENIAEILKASDAFVFSSLREGLPVALMEAMAAALPCVVSRIRGNVDLLEQTGGYLVGPDDADGFADAIRNLINGKDLRDLMGEKNKDAIVKYDVKNVVKILKDIYDGLT